MTLPPGHPRDNLGPAIRLTLWADAAVELVFGFVLLGIVGDPDRWLGVSRGFSLAAAVVFFVAAVVVAAMARLRSTSASAVRYLAVANIAGGAAVWLAALLKWDDLASEGRWLASAAADAFILLGLLEIIAVRRAGPLSGRRASGSARSSRCARSGRP